MNPPVSCSTCRKYYPDGIICATPDGKISTRTCSDIRCEPGLNTYYRPKGVAA